jgi:hypothetical protein
MDSCAYIYRVFRVRIEPDCASDMHSEYRPETRHPSIAISFRFLCMYYIPTFSQHVVMFLANKPWRCPSIGQTTLVSRTPKDYGYSDARGAGIEDKTV